LDNPDGDLAMGKEGLARIFNDRKETGAALAEALGPRALGDGFVQSLPRGGAFAAAGIAGELGAPLDMQKQLGSRVARANRPGAAGATIRRSGT